MAKVGPENAPVNLESEMEAMKIEKLTMDHVDKVFQFMIKEYCSDEPVFRLVFLCIYSSNEIRKAHNQHLNIV